jgi:purine-binding chemotaxis protein CheW
MMDLIVFSVLNNKYALNIENVQRIIQAINLTNIPNSSELVDGMMSYEDSVIKVLNFRKLIGLEAHEEDIQEPQEYSQKLIIYEKEYSKFAIKVDAIDDIQYIEESDIINADEKESQSDFLVLDGVLDIDGVLINVIKTVSIPS